jgi:catechol 2,3-dioxygenase-like lactoylglutathione lyase family enzyme
VRAHLVPELLVADIEASLRFWCGLCGFGVAYDRPEERFAFLDRDGAQVMLEERGRNRNWITGPLESPLGRGINFEISVDAIAPIVEALAAAPWPLFMAPERKWYRAGAGQVGVHQFLVQDPDGYLIRFSERLGEGS